MRNIKLTIEYDGTEYVGWQLQAEGRTIQGGIEEAILKLTGEKSRIHGSGRTDAGVHALAQVANFATGSPLSCETIRNGLNSYLPHDIRIMNAVDVPASFHARKNALEKVYEYTVLNRKVSSPLKSRYAYFFTYPLDLEAVRQAAALLVGEHDFRGFAARNLDVESTVRRITGLDIKKTGDEIVFRVSANGFLRHMVRYIAGTLLEVGRGKLSPSDISKILQGNKKGGPVAPPRGLCLMSVRY
jgi:tRNA pseudouridine38-40 synthase